MEGTRQALPQYGGLLKTIIERLEGDNGAAWFARIARILREGLFPIWRTFHTGGLSRETLLTQLGESASLWVEDIMLGSEFTTSPEGTNVDFCSVTVAELGFTEPPTNNALHARVRMIGMECEAEDGPNIRLQYQNQPNGEVLRLIMKPITDSVGTPCVFAVGRDGVRHCLYASSATPLDRRNLSDRLIFRTRK